MDNKIIGLNDKRIPILGQQPDVNIDDWVVIVSYSSRYLAKPNTSEGDLKTAMLKHLQDATCIVCDQALDFMSPIRPMQPEPGRISYTRDPVISMLDFTIESVPFYVIPTAIYFCCDLQEADKSTYKSFVAASLAQAQAYRMSRSPLNPVT